MSATGAAGGAAQVLRDRLEEQPEVLLVLGSGLSGLADAVEGPVEVGFEELPGFPPASVEGHAGRFVAGRLDGRPVLMQAGRFHVYEGHPGAVVSAPVRTAHALGIRTVFLTNAAGSINRYLPPGSLMLLDDHINLQWVNPLIGPVAEGEARFPDMSAPYDRALLDTASQVALQLGMDLGRGCYAAVTGPSYETPAEVRMLRTMGADVVGMSTVPEVIVARALGLRVMAVSLVTNWAAGTTSEPLDHREVLEVGRAAGGRLETLLRGVLARLSVVHP